MAYTDKQIELMENPAYTFMYINDYIYLSYIDETEKLLIEYNKKYFN